MEQSNLLPESNSAAEPFRREIGNYLSEARRRRSDRKAERIIEDETTRERLRSLGYINPNRKIFEARKRETAALGAGEKLVLGHPLAATIGDSARCMQNLEKVLFTGPKTSDTVTFICD